MLGGLFGSTKKTSTEKPLGKLSSSITTSILNVVGAKSIISMPGAAQKAFALATDPNAEARDFIDVIESDEALSARIIKIANSVFFDRGKHSETIEESVLVIGINELRCLLNATSLTEIFPSKHPARSHCWAHDVAVALIARTLAQRLVPAQADALFLAGLMHDVGKLLLIQRAPQDYEKIIKNIEQEGMDFCQAESNKFVFDHTEVGQLIGERWNFSSDLIDVIKNHHRNWSNLDSSKGVPSQVAMVKAADIFAHSLGLGHPRGFSGFQNRNQKNSDEAFEYLKIPTGDRKSSLSHFQRTFETEFELYSGKVGA